MNAALKRHAPNIEPNGIKAVVFESLEPAMIAVITSGAPFANARNVTPAKVGDISIKYAMNTKLMYELIDTRGQILRRNNI